MCDGVFLYLPTHDLLMSVLGIQRSTRTATRNVLNDEVCEHWEDVIVDVANWRDVENEIDYFTKLVDRSIDVEHNKDVVKELKVVKDRLKFIENASFCGVVDIIDKENVSNEIIGLIHDVHDRFVDGECDSCQSLGLVIDDTFG